MQSNSTIFHYTGPGHFFNLTADIKVEMETKIDW